LTDTVAARPLEPIPDHTQWSTTPSRSRRGRGAFTQLGRPCRRARLHLPTKPPRSRWTCMRVNTKQYSFMGHLGLGAMSEVSPECPVKRTSPPWRQQTHDGLPLKLRRGKSTSAARVMPMPLGHPITSSGVFPRPSAAKCQVHQTRASPVMTRCRSASVPPDYE